LILILVGAFSLASAQERDTDVPALMINGDVYLNQGNCELAQYFYQEALKLESDNDAALVGKGRSLACRGALGEAIRAFEEAIASNSQNISAHVQIALAYERQYRSDPTAFPSRLGEALEILATAADIAPDSAQVLNTQGIILYNLGNLDDAETALERAAGLATAASSELDDAERSRIQVNLGRVYRDLGKLEQARLTFRRAVVLDPTYGAAHNNLGNVEFALDNCVDAEYELAQAVSLNPRSLSAIAQLAIAMFECGNVRASLPYFERAVETDGAVLLPPIYTYLSRVYLDIGRTEEAVRRAQQGALLPPESAEAHFYLGQAYAQRGDSDLARNAFERALELDPGLDGAQEALGQLP
jgi:tetratricopeptide (TPR) repeat protein